MVTIQFHTTKMDLFLRAIFFWYLSGLIEQIGIHKKMSSVFNVGLINTWGTSLSSVFSIFLKFSLIFMNMQMRFFIMDQWKK